MTDRSALILLGLQYVEQRLAAAARKSSPDITERKGRVMTDVIAGAVFQHAYPFVRDTYDEQDEDGWHTTKTWKPGVRMESCGEDVEGVADGIGAQRLTIVGTFKPGRFPTRVFFTRIWISPSGKEFGNPKLRITTLQAFRVLAKGFRHEFWLAPEGVAHTPPAASARIALHPQPATEGAQS